MRFAFRNLARLRSAEQAGVQWLLQTSGTSKKRTIEAIRLETISGQRGAVAGGLFLLGLLVPVGRSRAFERTSRVQQSYRPTSASEPRARITKERGAQKATQPASGYAWVRSTTRAWHSAKQAVATLAVLVKQLLGVSPGGGHLLWRVKAPVGGDEEDRTLQLPEVAQTRGRALPPCRGRSLVSVSRSSAEPFSCTSMRIVCSWTT